MRTAIAFTLLAATAATLNVGCSGDTTIVIVQHAADTGVTPPPPAPDAGGPTADASTVGDAEPTDAAVGDAAAADATVDAARVDAGYDAGFVRTADGGYYFDQDAALCDGRFVILQMPEQDPAGLGRLLIMNNVTFTLKPSPPLTQVEAAAWCAARGARLPGLDHAQYLGANRVQMNWCPQIWTGLAEAGVGPCQMWLNYLSYTQDTDQYISSCLGGTPRTVTGARPTLCVYR